MEMLNFVVGLMAGTVLGAALLAITLLTWAMKITQGGTNDE